MTRLAPILLGLTFVMSVVTMVLVLLLFVTKPWDDPITEAELSEILRAGQETSSEEKAADRVAKCENIEKLMKHAVDKADMGSWDELNLQLFLGLVENHCLTSP